MKRYVFLIILISLSVKGFGQKYKLTSSSIQFFSEATIEDITAVNTKASGLWDTDNGDMVISIPMNKFEFANSLMQEHYNEKYLHTEKYPKAYFKGKISGFSSQDGPLNATGTITMHGVEKDYKAQGNIIKKGDSYVMEAEFVVRLEDHKIKIPRLMWQNIAEEVKITVNLSFDPYD